jgi:hypothetical protein
MTTEELIQQAFEQRASHAPDPGRVVAGLQVAARRARRRRVVVVTTATVAATVCAVLAGSLVVGLRSTAPSMSLVESAPGASTIPLRYQPTWLPGRVFGEVSRASSTGRADLYQARTWVWMGDWPPLGEPLPKIEIEVHDRWTKTRTSPPKTEPGAVGVDVNGHMGRSTGNSRGPWTCTVEWPDTAPNVLSVTVTYPAMTPCDIALRIARSVRPEKDAVVDTPLHLGAVPMGYQEQQATAEPGNGGCDVRSLGSFKDRSVLDARLMHATFPADPILTYFGVPKSGTPIRVGGRPARFYSYSYSAFSHTNASRVLVDVGHGRVLLVSAPDASSEQALTKERLIEIAAGARVGADPSCKWAYPGP